MGVIVGALVGVARGIVGALVGAIVGALVGVIVGAVVGAIVGVIVGTLGPFWASEAAFRGLGGCFSWPRCMVGGCAVCVLDLPRTTALDIATRLTTTQCVCAG